VYNLIQQAITNRRALRCRYESNKTSTTGTRPQFVFKPYCLWYCQRAWYAFGRRSDRPDLRLMKLNRFVSAQPTGEPYHIPDDFKLADHLGHAWRMIRGETRYRVAVRFKQPFAETASETRWHPTQEPEEWSDDGQYVTLRFTVDGLDEIVWWVLGYGPNAQVLEPPELREKITELLTQAAAVYKKNPKRKRPR